MEAATILTRGVLEKRSPAVNQIDSSSGTLGGVTHGVVEKMVPLIAVAPVPRHGCDKRLHRLLEAIEDDGPPCIEPPVHWSVLCANPALASEWADQLRALVRHVMAGRSSGTRACAKSSTLCYSGFSHAGRVDDLLVVLALDRKPF